MAELENQGNCEESLCTLILHDDGSVTLTGTRFDAAAAFFGDVPAALTVGVATPITAERPSQGADTAEVREETGAVLGGLTGVSFGRVPALVFVSDP